jgi:hypothetical protein
MKYYVLLTLVIFSLNGYSQINNDYIAIIDGDTLAILLTDAELSDAKQSRMAELRHTTKHKKKRLFEKVSCEIKLANNDTIFWAGIVDYYDNYLIALMGTLQQKTKNESTITPSGFRRVKFSEIEWIKTDGKRNIVPQLLLSSVLLCIGPSLTILSIKEDFKGEEDPFPPALIPFGLGITYLGARLFDDILTKTYYLHEWDVKIKTTKR